KKGDLGKIACVVLVLLLLVGLASFVLTFSQPKQLVVEVKQEPPGCAGFWAPPPPPLEITQENLRAMHENLSGGQPIDWPSGGGQVILPKLPSGPFGGTPINPVPFGGTPIPPKIFTKKEQNDATK